MLSAHVVQQQWLPSVRSQLLRLLLTFTFAICAITTSANAQMMFHSLPQAPSNPLMQSPAPQQQTLRPSLYAPLLKVKSQEGYLFENADIGVSLVFNILKLEIYMFFEFKISLKSLSRVVIKFNNSRQLSESCPTCAPMLSKF